MGSKYTIRCARYPFMGIYDDSWDGDNIVPFLVNLLKMMARYEIVNAEFRAFERMDKIDAEES